MKKPVAKHSLRNDLHGKRASYIAFGIALLITAALLLFMLPFATFTVVFLFGILMMLTALLHVFAALQLFRGWFRYLWLSFALLYLFAGFLVFKTPITIAIVLNALLGIGLMMAGLVRILNALIYWRFKYWIWLLLSGLMTWFAGLVVFLQQVAPFWLLGIFLAIDVLLQGLIYLNLARYIQQHIPPNARILE